MISKVPAAVPIYLSKISVESFLKYYYNERRRRQHELSKRQISLLKNKYHHTSVILIGGLGGFHFGPHLEHTLNEIVGGDIWSIGKGTRTVIKKDKNEVWRCGSGEYTMSSWTKEFSIVLRRLLQVYEYSENIRKSERIIILGHSSGGLINYVLGVMRKVGVKRFVNSHKKEFPGLARIKPDKLKKVQHLVRKSSLVAINTPFRGLCQRLSSIGTLVMDPKIMDGMNESFLNYLKEESGYTPLDVLDLATHSVMTPKNIYQLKHVASNTIGSMLRFLSKIQQRGPNDGFVPKESAYLQDDVPHPTKDLNLGHRDHRDVIEHADVGYAILKQLLKI